MDTTRRTLLSTWCMLGCLVGLWTPVMVWAESGVAPDESSGLEAVDAVQTVLIDELSLAEIVPLPKITTIMEHRPGLATTTRAVTPGPDDILIYSNTLGDSVWTPQPTGVRVADDFVTDAVTACNVTSFHIRVNGGIPGGDDEFSVTLRLWDGCPNLLGSSIIEGTDLLFDELEDDDTILHDLFLPMSILPIELPTTFWVQVSFSTRRSGWVIGSPAITGFSGDLYNHPFTGCNTWFGGWPNFPHASGYAEVWADETCDTHFLAYRAASPSAPTVIPPLGPQSRLADDLLLIVDECELSAYELGMRGFAGPYEMSMDLRTAPEGTAIAGTAHVFEGKGEGSIEVSRFTVPEESSVLINGSVWMTWQPNKPSTGVLNVGRPQAGSSDPTFAATFFPLPDWTRELITAGRDAIFHVTIFCRGEAPRGACCPAQDPTAQEVDCIEDVTVLFCSSPRPECFRNIDCPSARWAKDRCCGDSCCVGGDNDNLTCDPLDEFDCPDGTCVPTGTPPAFDPPCGTHSCCQPGDGGKKCENLFFDECRAITDPSENDRPCESDRDCPGTRQCQGNGFCEPKRSRWFTGEFCGRFQFECPFFACFDGEGDCLAGSDEIICQNDDDCPGFRKCLLPPVAFNICEARKGCANLQCCNDMCEAGGDGNFCCNIAWDSVCVNLATSGGVCPDVKPGNDFCFDERRFSLGANQIPLKEILENNGDPTGEYKGFADSSNSEATIDEPFPEPGFCCHNDGADRKALGTVWYWFEAPDTSARIHTCESVGTSDTLLQVFSVGHPDQGLCIDGSTCSVFGQNCIDGTTCVFDKQDACDTLEVIACNDDADNCGGDDTLSDICLSGLIIGRRYYILLGSPTGRDVGGFSLRIQTPCTDSPPTEDVCEGASIVVGDPQGFNLADTSLDCPAPPCVPSMKNDYWKLYQASCTGQLVAHTCEGTAEESPATTMAVYQIPFGETPSSICGDPSREVSFPEGLLVGCNDDAEIDMACTLSGDACDSLSDCKGKRCTLNSSQLCLKEIDCQNNCQTVPDTEDKACAITGEECTTTADCADFGNCAGFEGSVTEGACTNSGNACQSDDDCLAGVCGDDLETECDTTNNTCPFGLCDGLDFRFCSTDQQCIDDGFKACERWPCIADETCGLAECVSSTCGSSAYLTAPVFQSLFYLIRVGGEFGEEFIGQLSVSCEEIDCNENGGPDPFDIQQGISLDCNGNLIPDECEILRGSLPVGKDTFCDVDCLADCNENIVPDVCETITDCNNNGIADECELLRGSVAGMATYCDADCMDNCNADRIMDVCEIDVSSIAAHCTDGEACIFNLPCADDSDCLLHCNDAGEAPCTVDADCETNIACDVTKCEDGAACVLNPPCVDGSDCVGGPGTYHCAGAAFGMCDPDADDNGIPDACDAGPGCTTLVADFPPNCAIDARQPYAIDDLTAQGWMTLDVTVGPAGCVLALGDVAVNSLPTGPTPNIISVSQVGAVATITFDSVIPTENWTCVSLTADATQQVCIANLPGDVDGSGSSSPALDLIAIIDCLNNPGTCPPWVEDADRDGFTAVLDLTRVIDLFNGAGLFASWTGADLGAVACPSAP